MGRRSGELIAEQRLSARPSLRLTACLAVAVLLTTCTASDAATPSTGASSSAEAGTLRVAMTQPAEQGFDPQASYTEAQWEILRCCLDRTLLAFPGLPNYVGTQPVPDLASGPPVISADGMTWTFRLRRGLHYAPPLQNVEITSQDFVRALLRAGSSQASGPGSGYLTVIQGFSEYEAGAAATISGVATPDAFTLQVQEIKPDRSLVYLFAMPFTAPIPPLPGDAAAPFGVATGHPFSTDKSGSPSAQGYGPFLVASGPYMVEGADALDFSAPSNRQQPVAGFSPSWVDGQKAGSLTLVRNPSWSAATDPVRPGYPDRIEITIHPLRDPYQGFASGPYATVIGDSPPPGVLRRFAASAALRSQIAQTTGYIVYFPAMNFAQPPFDDPHVRAAVALALDRTVLAGSTPRDNPTSPTSHLVPDPIEGSLLSSWDPYPPNGQGDVPAAKVEMRASRYGDGSGTCTDPVCKGVPVLGLPHGDATGGQIARTVAMIRRRLGALGIRVVFPKGAVCYNVGPRNHFGLCLGTGWSTDYPDAGNMFEFMSSSTLAMGYGPTLLGATPDQLRRWHYHVRKVPSIEKEAALCAALEGTAASLCWARLDQLVVEGLHAAIPIATTEVVRLKAANITDFSLDQAFGEPALDRMRSSS